MNRREHQRFPCRRRVEIEFGDTGLLDEGSCLDVSETGMLLVVSSGLYAEGDDILVRFPGEGLSAEVRVVWARDTDDGRHQQLGVLALAALETGDDGRPVMAARGVEPSGPHATAAA